MRSPSKLHIPLSPSLPPSLQHNIEVEFSVWDMAGQEVYYATHQCFLSRNTLYLVVWNMEEKEKGIDYLRPWLLNIQVRRLTSAIPAVSYACCLRLLGYVHVQVCLVCLTVYLDGFL